MKYFEATIKWNDNGNIQDGMIFKIGEVSEDDDNIFFYLENEKEIEFYKQKGNHEWQILKIEELPNLFY